MLTEKEIRLLTECYFSEDDLLICRWCCKDRADQEDYMFCIRSDSTPDLYDEINSMIEHAMRHEHEDL